MTPKEHCEEVIACNEGHVEVLTEINVEEEEEVPHNQNNEKEEIVNEIVLNIDQLIQCQGSSSSSLICLMQEPKTDETTNIILCTRSGATTLEHNQSSYSTVKVLTGEKDKEEEERVCRICQLSQETSFAIVSEGVLGLIQLGCGCKEELGLAHTTCAEAWFRLKGNQICEICGEIAKNISGVWDDRLIEKMWNESGNNFGSSHREEARCWRGQPFCNFLMVCLVIAFVIPWFFRGNML